MDFQLENIALFIQGRYALGLFDVAKEGEIEVNGFTEVVEEADVKTRGILILGGIVFPLGSR